MIRFLVSLHSAKSSRKTADRVGRGHDRFSVIVLLLALSAFGCSSDLDSRLEAAYKLQESGNVEQMIVELQKILLDDPDNPEVNLLLGSAFVQTGRQSLAIPPLEIATQSDLYAVPAGVLLATAQFRTKAYGDAIKTSDRVLEFDAQNLTALFTRGRSYLATAREEEALADANFILDLKPEAQNAIIMKASALVQLGRRDEAESIWLDLREKSARTGTPNQAGRVCAQLALFYQSQAEDDRADATYTECLDKYPNHEFLQSSASQLYVHLKQPERVIEIYQRALDASPDDIRAWSRLSRELYQYGHPARAKRNLDEMVERFDTTAAWRLLAEFQRRNRNATEAREALEEAILRSEQPPEVLLYSLADLLVEEGQIQRAREIGQNLTQPSYRHLLAGAISLKTGHPQQALERFDAGLKLWPDNSNAHYLAGQAALLSRDWRRALIEFWAAVRIGDNSTDAALRLAEIYFASSAYPMAAKVARFQIDNRPYLDPTPYHIVIRASLQLDRIDQATEIANELQKIDPTAAAVVVEMAAIKRLESGPLAAIEYIRASDRDLSDPDNEPILRTLANDLNGLGRANEALELIDIAIATDDSAAPLHDLRARVLSHLGQSKDASISTNRALEIDGIFTPALEMKAFIALEAGDQAAALAALDAASEAAPTNSNYPYSAASVARKMGDVAGAILRLEETLARQPLFGPAANDLAWILATDRLDLERALRLAQIAARRDRSSNTLTTLGWVRHQRGEFDDAIKNYRDALEANADLPTVRYRLGLSLSESGQISEAEGLFDELVEGPDFPEIDAARAELARIKGS